MISATTKKAGTSVTIESNQFPDQGRFRTQDILWALGIWSVILTLSPVVLFYVLMVN